MTPASANPPEVYRLLAAADNAAADRVLLHALPRLDRAHRRAALDVLIQRRRLGAQVELVSGFSGYPEDLRGDILAHAGSLEAALRAAIERTDSTPRTGAIELIAESGDCKLAYLLNRAWSHSCPTTRELAGKTLMAFAERHFAGRGAATDGESAARIRDDQCRLVAALERALRCWELHFRTEVLTAVMWFAECLEPVIAEKVAQPRSRLAHALNALLLARPDPRFADYALQALTIPALRAGASRVIGRCRDDAFMTALIDESQRLNDTQMRKACASIGELSWLGRSINPLLRLPPRKTALAMRFLGVTGLPGDIKVRLFADALASGGADLRQAALRQLVLIDTQAATQTLRTLAGRTDDPDAETARRELRRRSTRPPPTRTPSPRRDSGAAEGPSAGAASANERLDEIFGASGTLDERQRRVALQGPVLVTPAAERYFRAKLASSDADERARALQVARLANKVSEIEDQVYRLAHDPDAVVRSHALLTLPGIPTATSVRILRRALEDLDSRVQASAVEVLDQLEVDHCDAWIEPKLDSPNARVRANAIKALLKHGVQRAGDVLIRMLDSNVRGDRLSALWVVQRLSLGSMLDRVAALATDDLDEEVRRRAAGVAHALAPWQVQQEAPDPAATAVNETER